MNAFLFPNPYPVTTHDHPFESLLQLKQRR